jgi:hypothetical protein
MKTFLWVHWPLVNICGGGSQELMFIFFVAITLNTFKTNVGIQIKKIVFGIHISRSNYKFNSMKSKENLKGSMDVHRIKFVVRRRNLQKKVNTIVGNSFCTKKLKTHKQNKYTVSMSKMVCLSYKHRPAAKYLI